MYPSTEQQVDQTTDQTQRRLVIKHGNSFLLLDLTGGMPKQNGAGLGLYINDTRFLSRWEMTLGGVPLHFLGADAEEGFIARLTYNNPAIGGIKLPAGCLSLAREIVVDETELVSETITVQNHLDRTVETSLELAYAADFADMFEVRGSRREKRGAALPTVVVGKSVTLAYRGLDNILRQTRMKFRSKASPGAAAKVTVGATSATVALTLPPHATVTIAAAITAAQGGDFAASAIHHKRALRGAPLRNHGRRFDFVGKAGSRTGGAEKVARRARRAYNKWTEGTARISTSNADFNRLLDRSLRDIYLLRQDTASGPAVAAGVPWFAVPFGRDSLIAGLQTLPFMPELSRDILRFLAKHQGTGYDTVTGEKPGRIMHELRPGEMAGLGEIPFRPYYGTVDATQLWLMLYARYVSWSGDMAFAAELWPAAEAALYYLARETVNSMSNMSGFIRYGETAGAALSNQGWKDSGNCIVYANGALARAPIAVCEAQGYLYAAWREVAVVAGLLGHTTAAAKMNAQAEALRQKFNRDFWMPEHSTVALALDGKDRQCDVVASNAGHLLGTGILSPEREKLVAERLMRDDMFSGWGIRTLASTAVAYQPMDYQVGAVWPHDNGMIACGMYQIGESGSAHRVARAMLDVALSAGDMRLPELFAGFARDKNKAPVPYQVACVPQLWAAGCAFQIVAGMVGLSYNHDSRTLLIKHPSLPSWLDQINVDGLKMGEAEVNLTFRRSTTGATTVEVTRVRGEMRCLVEI